MGKEKVEIQVGQDLEIENIYDIDIVKIANFLGDRQIKGATKFDITINRKGFQDSVESLELYTYYERLETDEEETERLKKKEESEEAIRKVAEFNEKAQYERLKKKYEKE